MSIRNRVMLVTLGLALVGLVVTMAAQEEDKILIVRDGSVEVYVNNSSFGRRQPDRKHKWSKGADSVQVFEDATAAEACTTKLNDPVEFDRVVLKIEDLGNKQTFDVVADNEGFPKKLKLLMSDEWRFVIKQYRHRLVYGSQEQNEERKVKLQRVVVTPDGGGADTSYPTNASTGFLCVKFRN